MTKRRPSYDVLQGASNHLHYEIWMMESLTQALKSGSMDKRWLYNALLESFVLHVRVLLEFFYNERPKKDDVVAEDYFDSPDFWQKTRPTLSDLLRKTKTRVGKEVAHITYARLKVPREAKPWPFSDIAAEISAISDTFLKNVSPERLGHQWKHIAQAN